MMARLQRQPLMTLGKLLPGVELFERDANIELTSITADSREVVPGSLFLAYPGFTADGRAFIDDAIASGASAVVADAVGLGVGKKAIPVIPVTELAASASDIAGRFHGQPSQHMRVIGVTGTNGKTTCTQLLAQLLQLLGEKTAVIGTLGYGQVGEEFVETGLTTADAVTTQQILAEMYHRDVSQVCMEVSSHSLHQGRVAGVRYHTAVFTNLSRDHLDYHGDMAGYAAAKATLFAHPDLQLAVLNGDDPASDEMAARLSDQVSCYCYAVNNAAADVVASSVELSDEGIRAELKTPWGNGVLRSTLLGEFNVSNLLAVVAAACGQGFPLENVLDALPELKAVSGRMQVVDSQARPTVVVDYAHTPDALEKALVALRSHCRGDLWCVFGCGGDRDKGKRAHMGEIATRLSDYAVVTNDNPRTESADQIIIDILAGMPDTQAVRVAPDRAVAILEAIACADENDCVLIAGKGHEQYQEVNGEKLPFSDVREARQILALRAQGQVEGGCDA